MADNKGFNKTDLAKIAMAIKENYSLIKTTWYEHCKDTKPKGYKGRSSK